MEGLGNRVRAVLVGHVVDLIAAQTHLLEIVPQHSCGPPRAERHGHVVRLRSHMPSVRRLHRGVERPMSLTA